jgi:VWFA-related protein
MDRLRILLLSAITAPSILVQSSAQSQQQASQFTLKHEVNRVVLDVVVTDANAKPAHGLSRRDFTVFEDGKKQKILFFDVHELGPGATFVSNPPTLPPNTFVNMPTVPERGPLYVLILDLYNTALDDQPYARQQLLKFISSKPEGTRFAALVLSDNIHLVHGFTDDRDQLYAALDPTQPQAHLPRTFLYKENYQVKPLEVLNEIATFVDGLPGRKNVIWFSGSFPLDLSPKLGVPPDVQEATRETLRALARTQTAIYPVDVRGVVAGWDPAATHSMVMALADDYLTEDEIARLTGGHAFYSRNDLKDVLSDATDLGGNYYTLTYAPSNENYDGKLRHVRVDLSQKGFQLEYRRAYYANGPMSATSPAGEQAGNPPLEGPGADTLFANMRHGAPTARQVLFRVQVRLLGSPTFATPEQMANLVQSPAYFRVREKSRSAKPLAPVQLQTYFLDYTILGRVPVIEVASAAYDYDGALLNADIEHTVPSGAPSSSPTAGGKYYRIQQRFDVPPNAAFLRLAVRDVTTNRIGALEFPLPLAPESADTAAPATNR